MAVTPPDPYRSARDLPSVAEMLEQIDSFKLLTAIVVPDQRAAVVELETKLIALVENIDEFYTLLGDRNWIYHETLNTEVVGAFLHKPAEDAEQDLIAYYRVPDTLDLVIRHLWRFPQMRSRRNLILRAREDYDAGRFDSATMLLLAVMDGFVNDVETEQRRGLHARSDDEMAAWDSVVGHHQGLGQAHRSFTKTFRKTSEDEVFELYRNGIVHGMLPNFNNVIVATKAWNRLAAVSDWAKSREKQAEPKEPEPTFAESLGKLAESERSRAATEAWTPSALVAGDDGFAANPVHDRVAVFLGAWKSKNYGQMASVLAKLTREESHPKNAGRMRDEYSLCELTDFEITKLDFQAPVICVVEADLVVDGDRKRAELRWIREADDGESAVEGVTDGEWRVMSWGPWAMFKAEAADSA